ncbi:hypothetical protein SDC9_126093 [bioreactor metagenome]|uniref:Uncharacterized protein n=1 Tax=bioreactor metagenome TaxID=1076179 RepID=A0A645CQR5_9ZZZZ
MEGERRQPQPAPRRRQRPGGLGRYLRLPQRAHGVCKQHLFRKAHGEPQCAPGKALRRSAAGIQLQRHLLVLHDGSRDELGKHGDKGPEGHNIPLYRRVFAVYVDGIAHGLERVKGDADGQMHVQVRQSKARNQREVRGNKIIVLKKAQNQQIKNHGLGHKPPGLFVLVPVFFHHNPVGIVDDGGQKHNEDVNSLSPAVKQQAHRKQDQIPPLQRNDKVQRQRNGKIEEQKHGTAEYQRGASFLYAGKWPRLGNRGRTAPPLRTRTARYKLRSAPPDFPRIQSGRRSFR